MLSLVDAGLDQMGGGCTGSLDRKHTFAAQAAPWLMVQRDAPITRRVHTLKGRPRLLGAQRGWEPEVSLCLCLLVGG
jgi:hypothetical protein